MKIEISPYQLIPLGKMGSHSSASSRRGALLRISLGHDLASGYADCFPWPEAGDLSLDDQLGALKKHELTPLTRRSLYFAKLDSSARSVKKSLFEGLSMPKSHFLLTDTKLMTEEKIQEIAKQGFHQIKLKVGSHPVKEASQIQSFFPLLKQNGICLRLDFNSALTPEAAHQFFKKIKPEAELFDFIEDPTPYDPHLWTVFQQDYGIRLALDWTSPEVLSRVQKGSFSVLILKPAIQDWREYRNLASNLDTSVIVTSYLDHPLGQLSAAWVAAQINQDPIIKLEPCGLISHKAYKPTAFSHELKDYNSVLEPPQGTGFGFDHLLSQLQWQELSHLASI